MRSSAFMTALLGVALSTSVVATSMAGWTATPSSQASSVPAKEQATTECGTEGTGNPTEASTYSQGTAPPLVPSGVLIPIPVLSTTKGLTAVLEVADGANLDLFLLDPLGAILASSQTSGPEEVLRWAPATLGIFSFLIVNRSLAVSPYGIYTVTTEQTGAGPSSGATVLGTDDTAVPVDCDDPAISRKGGWHEVSDDRASGGQYCRNVGAKKGLVDAFLEFQFTGTSVDMFIARGPRGGDAEVFIDGVSQGVVNFFRPPTDPSHPDNSGKKDLTFNEVESFATTTGTHVFRLEVLNDAPEPGGALLDMVYVDGFVIHCASPAGVDPVNASSLRVAVRYRNRLGGPAELSVTTPEAGPLSVDLFDVSGRMVREVLHEPFAAAGTRVIPIERPADGGRGRPSSVCFYRVRAGRQAVSGSLLFLR